MDDSRFDDLSRLFGRVRSRRHLVRATLGVLSGTALVGAADAGASTRRSTICRPGGYQCTRDGQCCRGRCQSIATPGGGRRRLVCACPSGQTLCGTRCVDLDTDTRHCGACGRRCRAGESCCDGVCAAIGTPAACSGCGDVCAPGDSCVDGECTSVCVEGPGIDACCDNVATTLGTDSDCDDCGDACDGGGADRCYAFDRDPDGTFRGAECCDCTGRCGVFCSGNCPDCPAGERCDSFGSCVPAPCAGAVVGKASFMSTDSPPQAFATDTYQYYVYQYMSPTSSTLEIISAPCTTSADCSACPAEVNNTDVQFTPVGCICLKQTCDSDTSESATVLDGTFYGGVAGSHYCAVVARLADLP